ELYYIIKYLNSFLLFLIEKILSKIDVHLVCHFRVMARARGCLPQVRSPLNSMDDGEANGTEFLQINDELCSIEEAQRKVMGSGSKQIVGQGIGGTSTSRPMLLSKSMSVWRSSGTQRRGSTPFRNKSDSIAEKVVMHYGLLGL
ncbi:hypothetical protein KSS87_006228, partial [Heliosperma pusillum]